MNREKDEENQDDSDLLIGDSELLVDESEAPACLPPEKICQLREQSRLIITRETLSTIKHCLRTSDYLPSSIRSFLCAFIAFFQDDCLSKITNVSVDQSTISKALRKQCLLLLLKWESALLLVCEESVDLLFHRNGELTSEFRAFLFTNGCISQAFRPRHSSAAFVVRGKCSREEFDERFQQFCCAVSTIEDIRIHYLVNDVKDE